MPEPTQEPMDTIIGTWTGKVHHLPDDLRQAMHGVRAKKRGSQHPTRPIPHCEIILKLDDSIHIRGTVSGGMFFTDREEATSSSPLCFFMKLTDRLGRVQTAKVCVHGQNFSVTVSRTPSTHTLQKFLNEPRQTLRAIRYYLKMGHRMVI